MKESPDIKAAFAAHPSTVWAFKRVRDHLLKQGRQSLEHVKLFNGELRAHCRYRGEDGLACAVGCLIKDEHYRRDFEGNNPEWEPVGSAVFSSMEDEGMALPWEMRELFVRFLLCLQDIHDNYLPHEWAEQLRWVQHDWEINA